VIPEWYHLCMAMTLRLSEKQAAALKRTADEAGISMQEAALQAVDEFINRRQKRLSDAISRVKNEDRELLRRLAQ
jgi:predicted transcriptional regulator